MVEQLLTSVAALLDNPSGTPDATLTAAITTTNDTSFTWNATPSGLDTTKSFVVRIDQELLYCDSVSGTTVTVNASGRGAEGSTAATHLNGANVYVVWSAAGLIRWFNSQQVTSLQGGADKVLYISHSGVITELALGASGTVLTAQGTTSAPAFTYPGRVLLEQHTASSSATLDFTTFISSAFDEYEIEFVNMVPATDAQPFNMRMGTGAGPTWDTGANYGSGSFEWRVGGSALGGSETGATAIVLCRNGATNVANYPGVMGSIKLFSPGGSLYKYCHGKFNFKIAAGVGNFRIGVEVIGSYESTTAVTGVQFYFASGNIASGTIRAFGVAK